ncbi:YncE family protein [Pseudothauera nasutitermitis]|uniref:YncE family protein n=1 Tax=Pseudothauera nasutitermitis TaxID=2565930 RepID=UPI001454DDD1|nr:YncE family protein [Pseudothauera nasutitermitis]
MDQHINLVQRAIRLGAVSLACLSLLACASAPATQSDAAASSAVAAPSAVVAQAELRGIYELVYSSANNAIYVAGMGERFGDGKGGFIYQLNADTLALQRTIELPLKPFALASDNQAGILYAGHSLESTITAIDVASGRVRGTVKLEQFNDEGKPIRTRQLLADESSGTLYVGGVGKGGIVWVLDGRTLAEKQVLRSPDGKSIGMALDASQGLLYTGATGAYEVIDTRGMRRVGLHAVPKPAGKEDSYGRYFINLALDQGARRLFATESTYAGELFVFDAQNGQVLHTVETGKSPVGIRFNPVRDEVYVANREGGTVTVVDAATYAVKRQIELPTHPNSLALSADGQVLFVTVKRAFPAGGQLAPMERVVRIDLQRL